MYEIRGSWGQIVLVNPFTRFTTGIYRSALDSLLLAEDDWSKWGL